MKACFDKIKVPHYLKMVKKSMESEEWLDSGKDLSASKEVVADI